MTRLCDEAERLYVEAIDLERAGDTEAAGALVVAAGRLEWGWSAARAKSRSEVHRRARELRLRAEEMANTAA